MNIPQGNTTPHPDKNYFLITDAVYFHRDNSIFEFTPLITGLFTNYGAIAMDGDNVLNVFFACHPTDEGGGASNVDPNSKIKFNVNGRYWNKYIQQFAAGQNPMDWYYHSVGHQVNHEIGHLLGLLHTVMSGGSPTGCPTNCAFGTPGGLWGSPANLACDDGCADTPTACDIAAASGCTVHPRPDWGEGNNPYKSNNLMDDSGSAALTPCHLNIIHSSIKGAMKTYTACAAVATDQTYCPLEYPRVTSFGRNITIGGCSTTATTVDNKQKIAAWFSTSVE